jgi:UDP-N-acetylmuramyl pentapeptide phosphotransferase/UDP-N-acetylglucosamine-1-phosphate transferase
MPPLVSISILLAALVISLGLTRAMITLGPKLGLMDQPDGRRVHLSPIPRAGGIAIWLTFAIMATVLKLAFAEQLGGAPWSSIDAFLISSVLLVGIGLVDDRRGMPARVKLGGQILAALIYWTLKPGDGGNLMGVLVPWPVDLAIWVMWIVLLINAFNLIDGLDGLCGGLVAISLAGIAALQWALGLGESAFFLALMGVSLGGFLFYNRHPARIFLGDAGSMMLGFFLATAATELVGRKTIGASILLPLAVAGVPLLDVGLAIWRRSVRNLLSRWEGGDGIGVLSPDKDHIHHRFLARGWSQRQVTRLMHGLALVLSLLAFSPILLGGPGLAVLILGIFIISLFGLRHLASVELLQSGNLMHQAVKRSAGRKTVRAIYVLSDLVAIPLAAVAALLLESNRFTRPLGEDMAWRFAVIFSILAVVVLHVVRIYRRVWSRARLREFLLVGSGLVVAGLIAAALLQVATGDLAWSTGRLGAIAGVMAVVGVLGPRVLPELSRELAVDTGHRHLGDGKSAARRMVIFGAGDMGNLYIDYLTSIPPDHFHQVQIVGFVDDNPRFRGRLVRGFEILGTSAELREVCKAVRAEGIILAIARLQPAARREVEAIARELRLEVLEWNCSVQKAAPQEARAPQEAVA